jgi:hypothetical protein
MRGRSRKVRVDEAISQQSSELAQEQAFYDQARQRFNVMPESELELTYFTTNPQWGDESANQELQENLVKRKLVRAKKDILYEDDLGKPRLTTGRERIVEEKKLWPSMAIFTRDIRLANYTKKIHVYCAYYYDLGNDLIDDNFKEVGIGCTKKAALEGEMSQGDGGMLRKTQNTLFKDERTTAMDVKKPSVMSGQRGEQKNY